MAPLYGRRALDSQKWRFSGAGRIATGTCLFSLRRYCAHKAFVQNKRDEFNQQTTDFVHTTKLDTQAVGYGFFKRNWLKLRWGCQMFTVVGTHTGDPYRQSQRLLVFVNSLLVSIVISILFFDVTVPECCTCIAGVCGNATADERFGESCSALGIAEADEHCFEVQASYHNADPPRLEANSTRLAGAEVEGQKASLVFERSFG
jgi:hypothetical protein